MGGGRWRVEGGGLGGNIGAWIRQVYVFMCILGFAGPLK